MAYEEYCAGCTYLGENCDYNGKYFCSIKGERRYASDPKCYNYCEAYSRSNTARKNMYDNSKNHTSSGCYLTTIICKLLNYSDNNQYLNTLRNFRDNIMQTNINYIPLLLTYDVVGPVISKNLEADRNGRKIASVLLNKYIKKAVKYINEGENEKAINIYTAMTEELANNYKIIIPKMEIGKERINPRTLGHGYKRVLIKNN